MEKANPKENTSERVCESAYAACIESKKNPANCVVLRDQCAWSYGGPF